MGEDIIPSLSGTAGILLPEWYGGGAVPPMIAISGEEG